MTLTTKIPTFAVLMLFSFGSACTNADLSGSSNAVGSPKGSTGNPGSSSGSPGSSTGTPDGATGGTGEGSAGGTTTQGSTGSASTGSSSAGSTGHGATTNGSSTIGATSGSATQGGTGSTGSGTPTEPSIAIDDGKLCIRGPVDLNVMMLMDTTGSMGNQDEQLAKKIPSLLQSIQTVQTQLAGKVKAFRLGYVGYIDQARNQLAPTTDIASAASFITQNAHSGSDDSDGAEGGIWAFTTALQMMKQASTTPTAINVVFLVTDAWSHDGGPCGPDCDADGNRTTNLTATASLLADPFFAGLFLYDWSPKRKGANGSGDFSDGTTGRFGSPSGQWAALRQTWQQKHGTVSITPGQHMGERISDAGTQYAQAINAMLAQLKNCD